ncbi:hypothetical protein FS749_011562 [Ceratobasidium sp. UAMH 11750]|nr:hypothetical protein FS749_011562 [Ceratobasidium sp. UAMH 11750]
MIRLPSLRLLEIVCLGTLPVAARLLSLLFPGTHELNIRLDMAFTGGENQANETCALLERSNPVSLALYSISSWDRGHRIHSYLVRTPNLRTLLINLHHSKGLHPLGELLTRIDSDLVRRLPYLRALCIVGGRIDLHSMMQLQCFVAIANLHYLVFLDCLFEVESPDDRPCGSERHENQGEEEEQLPLYVSEMPGVVKEWVPDKVGNVLFYESAPERTCQDLDLFIENLLKLDQNV